MFLNSDDFLDLTSINIENLDVILSANELNLKGIRSQSYEIRIMKSLMFLLITSYCIFQYNLEKDSRLQNFRSLGGSKQFY